MNPDFTATGKDTKSDHYKGLKTKALSEKRQQVMDAVLLAHAQGRRDFTNNELCVVMEGQLGRRVIPSDITSTITDLISTGLLAADYRHGRACSITGSTKVRTLFAVARQAGLGFVKARPDTYAAAKARADIARSVMPCSEARTSGMPPEVRAKLAALRQAAAQGK